MKLKQQLQSCCFVNFEFPYWMIFFFFSQLGKLASEGGKQARYNTNI